VARHFYHHAGWAQLVEREFPAHAPVGVVGQIIPWNFPLLMLAWKVAPALAAGNTLVLKPAEYTSLTALAFAELVQAAHIPPGVVNFVTGDGRTGAALVDHPGVDKIAFTGSTEVGRAIRRATAGSGKRLSLELGGKSPFLVFDDADIDSVIEGAVDAIWFNQGQVCCAGSRLLVQESVAERVTLKLRARMEKLRVGDPLDKAVDIGAIVAPVQLERIQKLVQQGVEEGATLWQPSWACPKEGLFYPPTLLTGVAPSATVAQVEIFGPVLVAMSFRTPAEAIALANNTTFGLAASVWTENVNLALDMARRIKAGTVWINATNLFDASSGFGGYRESGFGREGGREGMFEYLQPMHAPRPITLPRASSAAPPPLVDRTAKLFIAGKQARPDQGYSLKVLGPDGEVVGEVAEGNRKDVRNAVEAARAAEDGWATATAHLRAQNLYYIAENLAARASEFAGRITLQTGHDGSLEVETAISRLFSYAAWADKYDGAVHGVPLRGLTLALVEPIGVMGLVCPDEAPLLGFVSLLAPAVAMGNTVVIVPSEHHPLSATDLYQVLETSDLPAGVVNIVTGRRDVLAPVLASHDDVDAVWYFGSAQGAAEVEKLSAGNMKRTWTAHLERGWFDPVTGEGHEFLREATQVKNIWTPSGE
jgi:aldehyde dehydrogenase (NAD+)